MSTEELQLVLEMAQQAGEGAFVLTCIYLMVGFAKALIAPSVWIVFFVLAYKSGRYAFDHTHADKFTQLEALESRMKARLDWAKAMYPVLTKTATEDFVKGHANTIEAPGVYGETD